MISVFLSVVADSAHTFAGNSEYGFFLNILVGDSKDDCVLALKADVVGAYSGIWHMR
jgi:hypothetical protein